jgi:hypothetical protein
MAEPDAAAVAQEAARLWAQGRQEEAIALFRALQRQRPEDPGLALRLGMALMAVGRLGQALPLLEQAAALAPGDAQALAWLDRALGAVHGQGSAPEAIPVLQARLAEAPEDHNRRVRLASALLANGRFEEGWPLYAWRWRGMAQEWRQPADPLARPDPAGWRGRRVLLFAEQGFGDTLQFLRYVKLVQAAGAEVVVEVQPALKRLAATLAGGAVVVAQGEAVPAHDVAVPLLHLPWAFGTTLETIPGGVPYLSAEPGAVARWRARLAGLPGLKVGLAWAGDPRPEDRAAHRVDRRRSLPLAALAPLGAVPGMAFVSLQMGDAARQSGVKLHDWTTELGDFADTAALVAALDLVITVDTAVVHLAGALGRPVWMLNRFDSCWRWLRGRADSPWYPSLRIFRQQAPGEWGAVVEAVRKEAVLF